MNDTNAADRLDLAANKLCEIDWNDIDEVERASFEFFEELAADPAIVRARLDDLPNRPQLLALCEHYDILDKVVLFSDDSGVRVRLHVFLPGYFDRPHNHRWSYASRILRGQYRHYLFGNAEVDDQIEPAKLPVLQVREEPVGVGYALHHTMVHAVVAEPFTVSLVVRGPAVKDRFLVADRRTGQVWWQYGADQESPEESVKKRMTGERLQEIVARLAEWDLY
ncbi:hypothetical protein IU433_22210 [Nocardia puris]|nr:MULTISPECIES: hypothetical protein [Nocardia]MBF6137233.1 hypothetical protein [Nocardia otitidiscaviarum]MBF6181837.1 hypothetical protein [Nocardia otitidiscaviarum]MBF6461730.1 hypothetical protein [Nocardia puris]MBF6488130.1 hypothetical protein [Nocardia otitidiscaviarum]